MLIKKKKKTNLSLREIEQVPQITNSLQISLKQNHTNSQYSLPTLK